MSTPTNHRSENPNTYFVQDRSDEEELARLQTLDQMLTRGMEGVLPEQPASSGFQRILDVVAEPGAGSLKRQSSIQMRLC